VNADRNSSNLKNIITHDLTRLSNKKKLNKNKSPSFMSLTKKDDFSSKKSFKSHLYVPNKLYNLTT